MADTATEQELLKKIEDQNKEQFDAAIATAKEEMQKAGEEFKKGFIDQEILDKKIQETADSLKTASEEAYKELKEVIEDQKEILVKQGNSISKMKESGIINSDLTVNKGLLRTIVETQLEKAGLIGEEVEEDGIKVKPINTAKLSKKAGDSSITQVVDLKKLSKNTASKAGENMFIGGTGTQTVFNQAINRTYIGEISDPLTANEHALDIFSTTTVSGSQMTLMVYQNLDANGELVAEGAAPSLDSRIELTSKDFKVFDFSATATVSKNQLRDSGEVVDELVRQLASNIKTVFDNKLFVSTGDNNDDPWGVFNTTESCETFNPRLFTGTSPKANMISVFGKAKLQARLNDWATDSIILSPHECDELQDLKDNDENSIKDNRLAVDSLGMLIGVMGLRKSQTTKMPKNTALVYNSNLQTIGLRQSIETEFAYNADDFKKRKVSFVMDMRAAYGQRAKKSSIYIDDIKGAIAILKETTAESLAVVQGYATGSDASELTIATLVNAGVVDTVEANLDAYKTAVAAESSIENLAALQAIINTVNAA